MRPLVSALLLWRHGAGKTKTKGSFQNLFYSISNLKYRTMILGQTVRCCSLHNLKDAKGTFYFMTEQELIELQKQFEARIQELQNENAALKTQATEDKTASALREVAATIQSKPVTVPSGVLQDTLRKQAMKTVGGPALYHSMKMNDRLRANGQAPASPEEIETSKRLFGRNSSSIEAARLARHNPSQYSRLRIIHKEL
jgi:hypothetical protein